MENGILIQLYFNTTTVVCLDLKAARLLRMHLDNMIEEGEENQNGVISAILNDGADGCVAIALPPIVTAQ